MSIICINYILMSKSKNDFKMYNSLNNNVFFLLDGQLQGLGLMHTQNLSASMQILSLFANVQAPPSLRENI